MKKQLCDWCGENANKTFKYSWAEKTFQQSDERDFCGKCLKKLIDFIEKNDKIFL